MTQVGTEEAVECSTREQVIPVCLLSMGSKRIIAAATLQQPPFSLSISSTFTFLYRHNAVHCVGAC